MIVNNYLITAVNPANNETGIVLDKKIEITFSKDMKADTLTNNILLKKVNGSSISVSVQYVNTSKKAIITPNAPLDVSTQYEITVTGGTLGVQSVVGEYLSASKTYQFTTLNGVPLSEPVAIKTVTTDGYLNASWSQPAYFDPGYPLTYRVYISTSSIDPDANPGSLIWPLSGDFNETGSTSITIPKKLGAGNYYFYIRAYNNDQVTEFVMEQFVVTDVAPTPTDPTPTNPTPIPTEPGTYFEVVETYPKSDGVHVTPDKVFLLFSSNVDVATVTSENIYLLKKAKPMGELTALRLMTEYSNNGALATTFDLTVGPNVVVMVPTEPLENNAEYTVIVKGSVASTSGEVTGEVHTWSFLTKFDPFYGDPQTIKDDLSAFLRNVSDKVLYKQMATVSRKAWEVNSNTTSFDQAQYEDGAAPYFMHEYVRNQVAYDLLLNAYLQQSGATGGGSGKNIRLGDLSVETSSSSGGSGGDITTVLGTLKDRIKPWLDMVHGHNNRGYAKPVSVVKGETGAAYPEFLTRAEFAELGE